MTLVAAYYFPDTQTVNLAFDRQVDASGFVGTQFLINDDAFTGDLSDGTGGITPLSPTAVRITLARIGTATGAGVRLTAIDGAGLVASGDGAPRPGATDLSLPFG